VSFAVMGWKLHDDPAEESEECLCSDGMGTRTHVQGCSVSKKPTHIPRREHFCRMQRKSGGEKERYGVLCVNRATIIGNTE